MKDLILVSDNPDKLKEYQAKLSQYKLIPYKEIIAIESNEESGNTFKENAYLKAQTIFKFIQKPCLADDSGILVESLPNELGVHSRRFSNEMTDISNNALLIDKLKGKDNRKAKFVSTICLIIPGLNPRFYRGEIQGLILEEARGKQGFGYDPLFFIPEINKTMAQLTLEEKNKISHRAKAIEKLLEDLDNEISRFFW